MVRASVLCAALLVGFSAGFWSGAFQTFPYDLLRSLKRVFVAPAPVTDNPRAALFSRYAPPRDVVMLGDSLTQNGLWSDFFPDLAIANRGIGGETTAQIRARLDSVMAMRPQTVFVMAGINDLFDGIGVDGIVAEYSALVETLTAGGIDVVILSTLRCSDPRCPAHNPAVRDLNARLRALAASRGLPFVDLDTVLSDANGLRHAYTHDGVHLNDRGYAVWIAAIAPLMPPR